MHVKCGPMGRFLQALLLVVLTAPLFGSPEKEGGSQEGEAPAVRTLDEAGWKKLLSENRGRVLLVIFWATWCGPCRDEFPGLVKLRKLYKGRGVEIIPISMDDAALGPEVESFLRSYGVDFPSYLQVFEDITGFADRLDPDWFGALPATFLYDRWGRLVGKFQGAMKYEDMEKAVIPLL